jgi:hypothetical protein
VRALDGQHPIGAQYVPSCCSLTVLLLDSSARAGYLILSVRPSCVSGLCTPDDGSFSFCTADGRVFRNIGPGVTGYEPALALRVTVRELQRTSHVGTADRRLRRNRFTPRRGHRVSDWQHLRRDHRNSAWVPARSRRRRMASRRLIRGRLAITLAHVPSQPSRRNAGPTALFRST